MSISFLFCQPTMKEKRYFAAQLIGCLHLSPSPVPLFTPLNALPFLAEYWHLRSCSLRHWYWYCPQFSHNLSLDFCWVVSTVLKIVISYNHRKLPCIFLAFFLAFSQSFWHINSETQLMTMSEHVFYCQLTFIHKTYLRRKLISIWSFDVIYV